MTKTVYALEIWDENKYATRCLYRSDLYLSKKKVRKAFRDTKSCEVFAALYSLRYHTENATFRFEPREEDCEFDTVDDIAMGYDTLHPEIRQQVDLLREWVNGTNPTWTAPDGTLLSYRHLDLDWNIQQFTLHD